MLYTSPFELLNLPQAELQQIDKKLLQLKKKQWMAELQLQDSGILSVNGRELTKNDVLQLFDQLEHTDALAFHAAIAADPVLLAFLQTGKSKPGERFTDNPLYQDPAFIEFVSPFFREAFNRHILKALAASDHARIQGVFGNPLLLTGSDYDDCLGRLRGYLDEKLHEVAQLRNNLANDRRADMGSLHSYYVYDWVVTLNKLPDHFMPFREDYAIELYNLAVDLWNSKRRDEARAVLYGIQSLHTAPPIQSMIEELIQKTGKVAETAGSSSGGGGNVAWVIISLLLIIFKAGSTCNNNKSDYDFSRLIEKNNHPYQTSMRVGFMPLKPLTPRDSAFTAFLSTLFASATANDQEKGKALANGDDPYKALFAKDLFKPLVSQKAPPSESVAMEEDAPQAAPDKPIYRNKKVYNESDEKISTMTADEEPPMVVRDNEVDNTPNTSPIDIYNQSNYGCILFFYSSRIIKSVYVQPQSTYRLQLPKGTFHAFCYAGNHFKTGLAISMGKGANLAARKAFANMPRFAESPPSMRRYLLPANNLHFKAGNLNTSIETTASITINPNEKPSVDMMSGKGVTAYRTIVTGVED